ncbi:MAG: PHP domain-containing protein [Deltaproteobacteria bacterium]|nr:PHP domain-containing protein [Deltaproteobacteria bacterium]
MIIDMHVHTQASGDSSATVDRYCRLIKRYRKFHPFHGLVITEHGIYDRQMTYRKIAARDDVLIFQGVEVDTNLGHLLLYGITSRFLQQVDVSRRMLDSQKVIKTINDCGGIAVPAHPFRSSIFGRALTKKEIKLDEVRIIEELNGSNSGEENKKATRLMEQTGLRGIGGSDAHFANPVWFLNCATEFENTVHTMETLVRELRSGHFRAIPLNRSSLEEF